MSIKKILLCLSIIFLLWLSLVATTIWCFGSQDMAQSADSIIVLGASVKGDKPSPVFKERIRHAINLYDRGMAAKIIFTGGIGEGKSHSESSVGASMAIAQGVPKQHVLIEEDSHTTQQNLIQAHKLMTSNKLISAIIVSDPLHMKRAMVMAEDMGIKAYSSATPSTRYRGLKTRLQFLAREVYFIHHYKITGY